MCPLLILVNKSEPLGNSFPNPNATPVEFVGAVLDVATSGFRTWTIRVGDFIALCVLFDMFIKAVSALTGEGLDDAFKWVSQDVRGVLECVQILTSFLAL